MQSHFNNEDLFLALIGISKAFDKVDHSILIDELKAIPWIGPKILSYICNMLARCKGSFQGLHFDIGVGAPKDDPLSPLLFLIYINDLSSTLEGFSPLEI